MTTPSPTHEDWEKEFDQENWHAIEGANGMCACGSEKGICHNRLKDFIRSLLAAEERKVRERARDWVEKMWFMKVFNHDDWAGSDEVLASIQSYLEGKHKQV